MPRKIEISHRTIVFTFLLLGLIWVLIQLSELVVMVFISFILAAALRPAVDRLQSYKLPRALAIFLLYLLIISIIGGLIAIIIPGLVKQTKILIDVLPGAIGQIEFFNNHQQELSTQILNRLGTIPENLLKITVSIFGNLLDILTTLVVAFYILLYRPHLSNYLDSLFGSAHKSKIEELINEIEKRLGSWVRGELILMLAIGVLTYAGLTIMGMEIALPLAIIAGILEIVPNIGPLVSAVPSVLVALSMDPLMAIAVACLYFVVQFFENHLLVPNVMRKAVGVNPLVSILALMAGFRLAGPIGAILSIPMIIVVQTIGLKYFSLNNLSSLAPGDE